MLDFCGCDVIVHSDPNGPDSKECFKMFENGQMKIHNLVSSEPDILKGVIVGKKSWGLHMKMWSDGIGDGEFRMKDILEDFEKQDITIPDPLIRDFENTIRKRIVYNRENNNYDRLFFSYMLNIE